MKMTYTQSELVTVRSAMSVLIDAYREIASKENYPAEKRLLLGIADAATAFLDLLRRTPMVGDVQVDLHGLLSLVERALRMSMNKWQTMIKPEMSAEQKAFHRAEADEVGALLRKMRMTRGLPW